MVEYDVGILGAKNNDSTYFSDIAVEVYAGSSKISERIRRPFLAAHCLKCSTIGSLMSSNENAGRGRLSQVASRLRIRRASKAEPANICRVLPLR